MNRTLIALALASSLALGGTAMVAHAQGVSFLKAQSQGELSVTRLAGTRIYNSKAEQIGTINDIVLGADGRAASVVVNVGGIAGVGSKQVAMPFSALKVGPVVEGSRVLLINVTKEQLQAAPVYTPTDPGRVDRAKKRATEWYKVAKDKVMELSKQAGEAVQDIKEKVQQPSTPAPAPKQ